MMSIILLMALSSAGVPGISRADSSLAPQPQADSFAADTVVGEWWTQERDGRVAFTKTAKGTYQGTLTYGTRLRKDVNNPDPKLRGRPLVGIVLMWNLRYEDGEYVDGYVYNPEDGKTYRVNTRLTTPRSLEVRGFLGISLFGQTHTWTRYR